MKIITDLEDGGYIIHSTNREWQRLCYNFGLHNVESSDIPKEIDISEVAKVMKNLKASVVYLKGVVEELERIGDVKD